MSWTLDKAAPPYSPPAGMYSQQSNIMSPMQPAFHVQQQPMSMVHVPQQPLTIAQPMQQQAQPIQVVDTLTLQTQLMANQMAMGAYRKECEHSFKTEVRIYNLISSL